MQGSLLAALRSTDGCIAAAAVSLVVAALHSKAADAELVAASGLLPHRQAQQHHLLQALTGASPPSCQAAALPWWPADRLAWSRSACSLQPRRLTAGEAQEEAASQACAASGQAASTAGAEQDAWEPSDPRRLAWCTLRLLHALGW